MYVWNHEERDSCNSCPPAIGRLHLERYNDRPAWSDQCRSHALWTHWRHGPMLHLRPTDPRHLSASQPPWASQSACISGQSAPKKEPSSTSTHVALWSCFTPHGKSVIQPNCQEIVLFIGYNRWNIRKIVKFVRKMCNATHRGFRNFAAESRTSTAATLEKTRFYRPCLYRESVFQDIIKGNDRKQNIRVNERRDPTGCDIR